MQGRPALGAMDPGLRAEVQRRSRPPETAAKRRQRRLRADARVFARLVTAAQAAAAHHTKANELVAVLHTSLLERARHTVPTQPTSRESEELKVCAEAANEPGAQDVGIHFLGACADDDFVGPWGNSTSGGCRGIGYPWSGCPCSPFSEYPNLPRRYLFGGPSQSPEAARGGNPAWLGLRVYHYGLHHARAYFLF